MLQYILVSLPDAGYPDAQQVISMATDGGVLAMQETR